MKKKMNECHTNDKRKKLNNLSKKKIDIYSMNRVSYTSVLTVYCWSNSASIASHFTGRRPWNRDELSCIFEYFFHNWSSIVTTMKTNCINYNYAWWKNNQCLLNVNQGKVSFGFKTQFSLRLKVCNSCESYDSKMRSIKMHNLSYTSQRPFFNSINLVWFLITVNSLSRRTAQDYCFYLFKPSVENITTLTWVVLL